MADPFKETLDQVIDYSIEGPPSIEHLEILQSYLAEEELKVYALSRGLTGSLFAHYESCMLDKSMTRERVILVTMVSHIITMRKCHVEVLTSIGLEKVLQMLQDDSAVVRLAACKVFDKMTYLPYCQDFLLRDRLLTDALTAVLLKDAEEVALSVIPALSHLCQLNPVMKIVEAETVNRLLEVLRQKLPHAEDRQRDAVTLCGHILQCLWNVACGEYGKEVAIECKVVQSVCPFLKCEDFDVRRLAAGLLSAIGVAEQGKFQIINTKGAIEDLSKVALDIDAPIALRTNSVLALRAVVEAPEGLMKCGMQLIDECDIFNEILFPQQAAHIISTLLDGKDRDREALQALSLLVKEEAGRKAAWEILDIIPTLHRIAQAAPNQRIRGLTGRCLEALCSDNHLAQTELDKLAPLATEDYQDGGTTREPILATETAILLVQFQNDYTMKAGALHQQVFNSMEESQMIWNTVDMVEKARRKGVTMYYLNFAYNAEQSSADASHGHMKQIVETKAFVEGTWGCEVTHELLPEKDDVVVDSMRCLSGFDGTDLEQLLRQKSLKNLVVCGLMTDAAVDKTMRDAYERGFNVFGVTDCTAASSSDAQETMCDQVFPTFSQPVTHNQLLSLLKLPQ